MTTRLGAGTAAPRRLLAALAVGTALAGAGVWAARADQTPTGVSSTGGLATGLTEFNPYLLGLPGSALLRPGRGRVQALRPAVVRLPVVWSRVQPRSYRPPNLSLRDSGCARGLRPCVPWYGVRAQLRAIRTLELRLGRRVDVLVVIYGTPSWANRPRFGCRQGGVTGESRPVQLEDLAAYRRLVEAVLAAGRAAGVRLRWWSAWNEPNTASFVNPQRLRCSAGTPSVAPALYAPLVRTLKAALDAAPGGQQIVLGELSSPFAPRPRLTETAEFVRGLPQDVACAGEIWSQHQYVGDADDVAALEQAVDARGCPGPPRRFWITETGVGRAGPHRRRSLNPRVLRLGCQRLNGLLLRWYGDPRIDLALQYTFREDPAFTVGLADPRLRRLYPAYALWRAWGLRRSSSDPPPPLPLACR
ncbi:MAG TPA: hypothetical protein VHI73_08645 [Solirubrobacteraceae bacterium]|nr:hypothetical protein [Solirubrobacteraceae bacterium]